MFGSRFLTEQKILSVAFVIVFALLLKVQLVPHGFNNHQTFTSYCLLLFLGGKAICLVIHFLYSLINLNESGEF